VTFEIESGTPVVLYLQHPKEKIWGILLALLPSGIMLRGIDLAIQPGTIHGLLGPNGAGKTTLVRILATLLRPDAGTARVGGARLPERGHYVAPTVFSRVDPDSRLAQEEVFGPVLSILAAESDDDAVKIANNSAYGLSGAVWGIDQDAAVAAAARLQTGQVDVNGGAFNPGAPFGGYKQSGIGREIGEYGIADVLEVKSVQR